MSRFMAQGRHGGRPGQRYDRRWLYFQDHDGVEYEAVQYD
jgi:hypothetical protein